MLACLDRVPLLNLVRPSGISNTLSDSKFHPLTICMLSIRVRPESLCCTETVKHTQIAFALVLSQIHTRVKCTSLEYQAPNLRMHAAHFIRIHPQDLRHPTNTHHTIRICAVPARAFERALKLAPYAVTFSVSASVQMRY